jgi:hypothetical protein
MRREGKEKEINKIQVKGKVRREIEEKEEITIVQPNTRI